MCAGRVSGALQSRASECNGQALVARALRSRRSMCRFAMTCEGGTAWEVASRRTELRQEYSRMLVAGIGRTTIHVTTWLWRRTRVLGTQVM